MSDVVVVKASDSQRKVFGNGQTDKSRTTINKIPEDLLNDRDLLAEVAKLPANYNFEIAKTIWRLRQSQAKRVALQFPEGLLLFACPISDIIQRFTSAETVIMGDVTYGACCVDDWSARALGCDFMVHYGHSCLVPIDVTAGIKMLYVFVDISFDVGHLVASVQKNLSAYPRLALLSTIQFLTSLHVAGDALRSKAFQITIPQSLPLSPGEILGCTAPRLDCSEIDGLLYVGDGRFHLEAIMIANPNLPAFKYDPYTQILSRDSYDMPRMLTNRNCQIRTALNPSHKLFAIILGTLGRQGSPKVLQTLQAKLTSAGKDYIVVLLSEIFPNKLRLFANVDVWVQIACPRLSIDWGNAFAKPLLSPYELTVALTKGELQTTPQPDYPMDFYARNSLGPWTPNYAPPKPKTVRIKPI